MLSYEAFFLIIVVSILSPVIGLLVVIFTNMLEQKIHLLEIEKRHYFLESELQRSQYLQLNQQIQPHFFFNALNTILSLARLKRWEQLISAFEHLIKYLRNTYQDKKHLYPLNEELDHTSHYLAIQKVRFAKRLEFNLHVEPNLQNALIPPYILQTLVENSFKHGLEKIESTAILHIFLKKTIINENDYISLKVTDNGPGFSRYILDSKDNFSVLKGYGLQNIIKRLDLLFPNETNIYIKNSIASNGAEIEIVWPLIFEYSKNTPINEE